MSVESGRGESVCMKCGPGSHSTESCPKGAGLAESKAVDNVEVRRPTPEELADAERDRIAAEDAHWAGEAAKDDAKEEVETLRESGPEVSEFNGLIEAFEQDHSLEVLHAITVLAVSDAPNHPGREPARVALGVITKLWHKLKKETDIPAEELERLRLERKKIFQAVGVINSATGVVDHTR
jgi:hypothetical protein